MNIKNVFTGGSTREDGRDKKEYIKKAVLSQYVRTNPAWQH